MSNLAEYLHIAEFLAPAFTALGCAMLLLFSYGNRFSSLETRVKKMSFYYMCASLIWYGAAVLYTFFPLVYVWVQSLFYLALLWGQVFFYRIFHALSATDEREHFSRWHYIIPLIIAMTQLVWSLFIPFESRLEITEWHKSDVAAQDYLAYTLFSFSKKPVWLFYCGLYFTFTVVRLARYYRKLNASSNLVRRPARWILLLLGFTAMTAFVFILLAFAQSEGLFLRLSHVVAIATLMMCAQHIILTFTVVQRRYVLYVLPPDPKHEIPPEPAVKTMRKPYSRASGNLLTRRKFDTWMRENQPWLDPSYKLTDLVAATQVNRSYLSRFINTTYGMNFNRYLNSMRLNEMARLISMPSNRRRPLDELVVEAGFSSVKYYRSIIAAEKKDRR